jgi:multidrug resistance efflux pump
MRTFVILGVILILASIVGAKFAIDHQTSAGTSTHKNAGEANQPPDKIVCWGFFDVEPGEARLYPTQFGRVVEVKPENYQVKETGEVLLQIDDKLAKLDVEKAKAAVKVAQNQLAEALHLPEFYKLQKERQNFAIAAIDHEITKLKLEEKTALASLIKDDPKTKNIKELFKEGLALLGEKKKAEEAKLKQLKLQDAQLKINEAEADLDAKNVQLEQAQEMLKHFQIRAPSKGTVLRVHVRNGETLGPNPRMQAIDFLPDAEIVVKAEVLQEWGRFVKEKQAVEIEDDTYNGPIWKGEVKSISKWYAPTRSPVIEPLRYNDVRTLECIIRVEGGGSAKLIGQRVRAKIMINN